VKVSVDNKRKDVVLSGSGVRSARPTFSASVCCASENFFIELWFDASFGLNAVVNSVTERKQILQFREYYSVYDDESELFDVVITRMNKELGELGYGYLNVVATLDLVAA